MDQHTEGHLTTGNDPQPRSRRAGDSVEIGETLLGSAGGGATAAREACTIGQADATEHGARVSSHSAIDLEATLGVDPAASGDQTGATPPRFLGEYRLLGEIARGGMGVVHRALQVKLGRVVALKLIRDPGLASYADLRRFQIEAESVAQLDHPNIVPIYEVGQVEGQPYFSMKLVEGGSLSGRIGQFVDDPRAAARLMVKVARAVSYAHQRAILHRDIKPSNVLIDEEGEPYVTDFGLAKRFDGGHDATGATLTGVVLGTPGYMPPEQARGQTKALTTAADVYSLGATLYEALTGRPPFQGDSAADVLRRVLDEEPPRPRSVRPGIDRDLETICLKCLEKDPARRYPSAEALAADLDNWLEDRPIAARPSSPPARLAKWARRRPEIAALAVLAVAAALLGLGGVLWQWTKAEAALARLRRSLYVADMQLGVQALGNSQYPRVEALVTAHLPDRAGGPDDPRGFEWHHLRAMAEPETMIIRAHDGPAKPVRFSPDGKLVGTCGDDGAVRLWDPATGALVRTFEGEKGHGKTSFDLDPRGGRIVVTGPAGTVECYELATGRRLRRSGPLPAPARTLVFSPDGKRLAVGHETPPHTLLDADTLEVRSTIGTRLSHERRTTIPEQEVARGNFVFNHAGDRIGHNITTTPNQMRIAESASDRTILTLPYILYDINPIFTADDRQLVVSGETGVRLIDSATGSTLHIFEESRNGAFSVINRQGDTLATVSWSGERQVTATANRFKLWHLPSRRELRSIPTKEADIIRSMAFSPDGQTLAAATFRGRLFFWFQLSGRKPATLQVAGGRASGLVVSPSGAIVAVGGHDGSVGLVELTPTPRHRGLSGPGPAVFGISVNPDGRTVASACADGHVRVRDAKDGGLVRDLTLGPGQVLAVAFDPSRKRLAAAGDDRKLVVWDLASGNTELSVADAHDAPVLGLTFSPDGSRLATCGGDRAVRIRDARTGRVLRSLTRTIGTEEEEPFSRLSFSPDGRQLVGASTDGTAVVWDVGGWSWSPTPRLTLTGHTGAVHDAGFSPDGRRVITAGADGTVRLWDPVIGVETLELRAGAPVAAAAFMPDGLRILAAGWDGVVTVWDARPVMWIPGRGAVYGPG